DRQAEGGKARGIAVGVERQPVDLRLQPLDHMRQQRLAAERAQALVAPAHALRLAAGEYNAHDGASAFPHFSPLTRHRHKRGYEQSNPKSARPPCPCTSSSKTTYTR